MSYAVSITQDGTRLETAGKYVDDDIVVGISDSIKKAAQTYTPGTTDQTIAAGQYLSGAQTVKGDANLIAGNIRSGKSIFGVAGSLTPGITPTGTKSITANGTYDVTEFASAAVDVPNYAPNAVTATVNITSDIATSQWVNLISSTSPLAAIIAQHRDDVGLYFLFNYIGTAVTTSGLWCVSTRASLVRSEFNHYGSLIRTTATGMTSISITDLDIKNGTSTVSGNVGCPRINANGSVDIHVYGTYPIRTGSYRVIIGW